MSDNQTAAGLLRSALNNIDIAQALIDNPETWVAVVEAERRLEWALTRLT